MEIQVDHRSIPAAITGGKFERFQHDCHWLVHAAIGHAHFLLNQTGSVEFRSPSAFIGSDIDIRRRHYQHPPSLPPPPSPPPHFQTLFQLLRPTVAISSRFSGRPRKSAPIPSRSRRCSAVLHRRYRNIDDVDVASHFQMRITFHLNNIWLLFIQIIFGCAISMRTLLPIYDDCSHPFSGI